ncbi:DinB family protein [Microlunatus speluncae]|uniref:DinB family protein n=1 Tax=Microlunatus speluncae TaxID=2594267 RepID=UPI001375CECD|nr:DinB family protein [Microlunatus speluncae]
MTAERDDLLSLSDFAWQRLLARIESLDDEEYLWQPAEDSWSVRPDADGVWQLDGAALPPDPAPITTIAWRLSHLGDVLSGERNATWIGLTPEARPDRPGRAGTVAECREHLDDAYAFWRRCLAQATELDLTMGPIAGPYQGSSRRSFLLHELDELIHHAAEVGVLRDLFAASRPQPPIVAAALGADRPALEALLATDPTLPDRHPDLVRQVAAAQRWPGVELLVELGFPADPPSGTAAVHYAAGAGELRIVRLLVDHGADLEARDPTFHETPRGWAAFFGQTEVAEALG